MDLEGIEGIRTEIKKLKEDRELNIKDAIASLIKIKEKYASVLEERGELYCVKNYSDIIIDVKKLSNEFSGYRIK